MSITWMVVIAVVAIIVLRRLNEFRPEIPRQMEGEEAPPPAEKQTAADRHGIEEDWVAELDGEEYRVECLDGETWTIYVECDELPEPKQLEVDARAGFPAKTWDAARDTDVQALLHEGVNYLDVGYNTEWIAASLPINEKKVPVDRAERIVRRLLSLRTLSS